MEAALRDRSAMLNASTNLHSSKVSQHVLLSSKSIATASNMLLLKWLSPLRLDPFEVTEQVIMLHDRLALPS